MVSLYRYFAFTPCQAKLKMENLDLRKLLKVPQASFFK